MAVIATARYIILGSCLSLASLGALGCSGERKAGDSKPKERHALFGGAAETTAEQPAEDSTYAGDAENWADTAETDDAVARALAGRWEARLAGRTVLIELEAANGNLSGTVREGDKEPVPIRIGVVTNDGFVFETGGGGRWLWTAKLSGDVLAGRREKVATGLVENFDAHRAAD